MRQPDSNVDRRNNDKRRFSGKRNARKGVIALVVAAAIYLWCQPIVNERWGLNLPPLGALIPATEGDSADPSLAGQSLEKGAGKPPAPSDLSSTRRNQNSASLASSQSSNENASGNSRRENATDQTAAATVTNRATPSRGPPSLGRDDAGSGSSTDDPRSGIPELLHEVRTQQYLSPAGILYGPGSQEGHRLEHLRRHTRDDPRRPGPHGVFDGGMDGALKTIDDAYRRAKRGQRTVTRRDRDRTIHTVDMGNRVGFVGGREGARRQHPLARRVRIVLEENRFITAYPL